MDTNTAKANGAGRRWSKEESDILVRLYPKHGSSWEGWKDSLPEKTPKAILNRAIRMGLKRRKKPQAKRRTETVNMDAGSLVQPDPYEDVVAAYMSAGFPPSEIDRRMKWFRGSAGLIVSNMWKRDAEGA